MFLVGTEAWHTATSCEDSRDTKSLPCDTQATKREQERQAPVAPRRGPRTLSRGRQSLHYCQTGSYELSDSEGAKQAWQGLRVLPTRSLQPGAGRQGREASRAFASSQDEGEQGPGPEARAHGPLGNCSGRPLPESPRPSRCCSFLPF